MLDIGGFGICNWVLLLPFQKFYTIYYCVVHTQYEPHSCGLLLVGLVGFPIFYSIKVTVEETDIGGACGIG